MFSNSLMNSVTRSIMSNRNSRSPPRKKDPLKDSLSRMKKANSVSSQVLEPVGDLREEESDLLQKSNINSITSEINRKSKEVITQDEPLKSPFNGKKQWDNAPNPHDTPSLNTQGYVTRNLKKESDLVGMLSKQLYLAENQMQRMQAILNKAEDRLKSRDQEIGRLKRKVKDWETKSKNQELLHKKELQEQRYQTQNSEYLYRRCLLLEHKIYEMEEFLADYGLMWMGGSSNIPTSSNAIPNDYIENCFSQLTANIRELNMAVGKGEMHVHHNQGGGGASFKTPSCMSLKFYKNGLVVKNGALRSYEDPTVISFVRDILDGYFPTELQQTFPDGVPFKVQDHRTEIFIGSGRGFPGHGYRLGKEPARREGLRAVAKHGMVATPITSSPGSAAQLRQHSVNINSAALFCPSSSRYSRTSRSPEPPAADLTHLRLQILASHNNNCSDSHIQSHINAELGLGVRRDKKQDVATNNTQCHISMQERTLPSTDCQMGDQRFSGGRRAGRHSSTDWSLRRMSPSRVGSVGNSSRSRSRSASLTGDGLRIRSQAKLGTSSGNASGCPSRTSNCSEIKTGCKRSRAAKSATQERKTDPPLLHQINEPAGKPGELRLKVRSLNGSTVYLVYVSAEDTVARLYDLLDSALMKSRLRRYKIVIGGFTPKRLEQLEVPLRYYGISRDSVLHLVNN